MESRDLVLVSMATGLETLDIAKKWLSKISIFQRFLFVAFAGKKTTTKRSEKCHKFEKKFNFEVKTIFYKKKSAKSTNFEVSSLGNFDEVPVSKF